MKLARRVKRMQRQQVVRERTVQLNIVSMIDVFAVLVFFLLVSSSLAAARLNVINLNLPAPDRTASPDQPKLQLTAIVRKGRIEVSDPKGNQRTIVSTPAGYNLTALADLMVEVKKNDPSNQNVTLLLEPEVVYDDVVKVMDTLRLTPAEARNAGLPRELFPQISIGDAPQLSQEATPAP